MGNIMVEKQTYLLNNGIEIPVLGLGTWLSKGDDAYLATLRALKAGYRHIDTAQAYDNEIEIGRAIKDSKIPRNEIFITSKIAAEIKDYKMAKKSIDESLSRLGLDYIDLMIIHSPQPWAEFGQNPYRYQKENLEVYKALEEYYQAGKLKAIGVSNFSIEDIQNILEHCHIKPMVNQICVFISNIPYDNIEFCHAKDIAVEAYSPLSHRGVFSNPELIALAKKYNRSVAQISLRFLLDMNLIVIPKARSEEHICDNMGLDFTLDEKDFAYIKTISTVRSGWDGGDE